MIPSSDLGARDRRSWWKKHAAAIVCVVVVGIVLLSVALLSAFGGLFAPPTPPSQSYVSAAVATRCSSSPCASSIAVTANSFLFMGFGYSVAQAVAGTMEIHGYAFIPTNEYTKQNFGVPSLQAGFYYWAITSTATVTVYLNYSTPATADVTLEDFPNVAVVSLPSIDMMGDGNGISLVPTPGDVCSLGPTLVADEVVVAVTMAGAPQSFPPTPETYPIFAAALPAEITGVPYSLVGEFGVLPTLGPTNVTGILSTPSAYATVCLGILPA